MISINWQTRVITIPQADLTPLGGTIYELDLDWFRLQLKSLEDSEDGISHLDTHRHVSPVSLSGVTYARFVEIINGYTIVFEDTGSFYTVSCVGANHNLADVTNYNMVNLIVSNSAGLVVVSNAGDITAKLEVINRGVQKASNLITHDEDLPP